jgi:hypothetical protein
LFGGRPQQAIRPTVIAHAPKAGLVRWLWRAGRQRCR